MWCSKRLSLETLSILIYANGLKITNSMLLLFDPIAFLDYISLFLSQGDIYNLFSTANEERENFSQCFNSSKFSLNAQNPQKTRKETIFSTNSAKKFLPKLKFNKVCIQVEV